MKTDIEIKAGPELDKAVKKAAGFIIIERRDGKQVGSSPSTDLNAAFEAAEAVGLFSNVRVLRTNRYHWEVMEVGDPLDRIISKGDTPALAICAAILKLKE